MDEETRAFFQSYIDIGTPGIEQLQPKSMKEDFNRNTPDHPLPVYLSYSGKMAGRNGAPLDPLFFFQWLLLMAFEGSNDGLVSVTSARWGNWRGVLPATHRDQIGHLQPREWIPFNRLQLYGKIAREITQFENLESTEPRP